MFDSDVEIVDRHGRRRRARRGETLADGERFSLPMQFMDAALRDELVEKYSGGDAIRVVDSSGAPAGHRPGFLFDCDNALADAADEAYEQMRARLDAKTRKRGQRAGPDDDEDDDDGDRPLETELERRQRLARKAARATLETDAMTLDELREQAEIAHQMVHRISNAWRTR